jgi:hypothetical protein
MNVMALDKAFGGEEAQQSSCVVGGAIFSDQQ